LARATFRRKPPLFVAHSLCPPSWAYGDPTAEDLSALRAADPGQGDVRHDGPSARPRRAARRPDGAAAHPRAGRGLRGAAVARGMRQHGDRRTGLSESGLLLGGRRGVSGPVAVPRQTQGAEIVAAAGPAEAATLPLDRRPLAGDGPPRGRGCRLDRP